MSAIVAAAEVMRDERLGPLENVRYRDYAADIHDNAAHLLALINRALGQDFDLSSVGASASRQLDTQLFVEAVVSGLQPLAEASGLRLAALDSEALPRINVDALSMRQILINLLTNAINFTPPGGEVLVRCQHLSDAGVMIQVSDTGCGMNVDDVARVNAGLRVESARPSPDGGQGIGLALVADLARANGATFDIASVPGQGTVATITIGKDRVVPV